MTAVLSGEMKTAEEIISEKLDDSWTSAAGTGDELMWRLEGGSFFFLNGAYQKSIEHLDTAGKIMEDFDHRALINARQIGSETMSLATNLNALPYQGLCRDRILYPLFKAFSYLGLKDEDGFRTELFRLRENQDRVTDLYHKYFQEENKSLNEAKEKNPDAAGSVNIDKTLKEADNAELKEAWEKSEQIANLGFRDFLNPFAIFMSGYGFLRDHNYQNAIVDFERLYKAMPNHPLIRRYYVTSLLLAGHPVPDSLKAEKPFDFSLSHDNILVVFANGRSAAFRQIALYIPVYYKGYFILATTAWPVCEYYMPVPFANLTVRAGNKSFTTESIADMDGILSREYKERLPGMITRILLSTAAKEVSSLVLLETARRQSSGAAIGVALGASAYKAVFNTADTRSWEILPKEYQIVQLPMPPDHQVTLELPGQNAVTFMVPADAGSAVIYVNAPSQMPSAISYRMFQLKK